MARAHRSNRVTGTVPAQRAPAGECGAEAPQLCELDHVSLSFRLRCNIWSSADPGSNPVRPH